MKEAVNYTEYKMLITLILHFLASTLQSFRMLPKLSGESSAWCSLRFFWKDLPAHAS